MNELLKETGSADRNKKTGFIIQNHLFHHEPISWDLDRLRQIHAEMITVMAWINRDIPAWLAPFDRFDDVCNSVEKRLR